MEQVRDALFHTNHPFLMVMVGPFGSGKSSIINALLGSEVLDVGPIPTTDHIVILRRGTDVQRSRAGDVETVFHPSPLLET
jgi:predicted GTPase